MFSAFTPTFGAGMINLLPLLVGFALLLAPKVLVQGEHVPDRIGPERAGSVL